MDPFCPHWKSHIALFFLASLSPRVFSTTFFISNSCTYTVWPGILNNAGNSLLMNGGFVLESGQSTSIDAPSGWSGRFWGRTGCNFSSAGVGTCASGDCGGKLQCSGMGANPPATLAEFTLQGAGSNQDYYDVSLVDGFNLPLTVTPTGSFQGTCGVAGCGSDINNQCPSELQVMDNGAIVSCKSACLAFQSAQYCCSGAYANPTTCKPTTYSELFKAACPNAYSYAFDDPSSIFTCSGANYAITFCPSGSSGGATNQTSSKDGGQTTGSTTTMMSSQAYASKAVISKRTHALMWAVVVVVGVVMWTSNM